MQGSQQDPRTAATLQAIRAFDEATRRLDIDGMLAACTDDVVWEGTDPPDGRRAQGKAAVRAELEQLVRTTSNPSFEIEETVALGDRAFFRWTYRWTNQNGQPGHVRGVDLVRVRDGKIAEMLAYVKG
jgi:ketosteroid isomerase-like protein